MNKYFSSYILSILILFSTSGKSQEYLFDSQLLTPDDGLSSLHTMCSYKDKKGFLWFGTKYGLDRYDGYSFKSYSKEKNSIQIKEGIRRITEDEAGNFWLFYSKKSIKNPDLQKTGVDVFNPKTERGISIEDYFGERLSFKADEINIPSINDPKKRLWITTYSGQLFLYENGEFKKIFESKEQKNTDFKSLTIDEEDNIWLAWDNKAVCITSTGEIIESFDLPYQVLNIFIGKDKTVFFATFKPHPESFNIKTIMLFCKNSKEIKPFYLSKNGKNVHSKQIGKAMIYLDSKGYWYCPLGKELGVFNTKGEWIFSFDASSQQKKWGILHFLEDDQYLWISTPIGVYKISILTNPFQLIHTKKELSACRGITEDEQGNLFFLNTNVYHRDFKTNQIRTLSDNPSVNYALIYSNGTLWASSITNDAIGFQIDLKTNKKTVYPSLPAMKGVNTFAHIKSKYPNKFLVGTTFGLVYLDFKLQQPFPFEKYKVGRPIDALLKNSTVYHLHRNQYGIWAATDNGVFLIDEEKGILQHFDKTNAKLPVNQIKHIYEDATGIFWMATHGGGVLKWQPPKDNESPSINEQFTTKDGLSNNYTYAVYEDEYGYLWIPGDKGLMRMNKTTAEVKTYLKEDGLPHNEFNLNAHYQAKDGTLYFGGLGGLIGFHPKVFANDLVNEIPLTFVKYSLLEGDANEIADKTYLLENSNEIFIRPNDKLFELEFTLLDYVKPEEHQYAYKIVGYNDNWTYINENYLRITSLPYGDYKLIIKGKIKSDNWSNQQLSLGIHVLKPFYLQWWFISLIILFVLFIVRWRIRQLEKDKEHLELEVKKRTHKIEEDKQTIAIQAEELRELDKVKTRFFSNITHEFRTPLTLVIGPVEQLINNTTSLSNKKKLSSVLRNAQNLLGLVNQLLDISKLENRQMKVEISHGDIVRYTQELVNRFDPMAKRKGIRLVYVTDSEEWKTHFDNKKWDKIINNLLSNAVKFTPEKKEITIRLQKNHTEQGDCISVQVKDTGIGIKQENLPHIFDRFYQTDDSSTRMQEGTGIGLALVKELVELQKGTIEVQSTFGKGTSFSVNIPVIFEEAPISLASPKTANMPALVGGVLPAKKEATPIKETEKLRLLIIEDNTDMRAYIRSCLDEYIYQIFEAGDGAEGVSKALEIVPDLIISDVMMPKKDGFQVTYDIRNDLVTSHIPLILLTAKASLESRLKGLERGADAYLTKPFKPQELVLRTRKLIELRQDLQTRYQDGKGNLPPSPTTDEVFQKEDKFVKELKEYILTNINEANLTADSISRHFAMSRMQFYRKLKSLTNMAVSEFVRGVRLNLAMQLLQLKELNMSEIAYETGFSSPSNFTRAFKKYYGKAPSEI